VDEGDAGVDVMRRVAKTLQHLERVPFRRRFSENVGVVDHDRVCRERQRRRVLCSHRDGFLRSDALCNHIWRLPFRNYLFRRTDADRKRKLELVKQVAASGRLRRKDQLGRNLHEQTGDDHQGERLT